MVSAWGVRAVTIGFLVVTHTRNSGNTLLVYSREIINYIETVTIFRHQVTSNSNGIIWKLLFFFRVVYPDFFDQLGTGEFLENFKKEVFSTAFSAVP